MAKHSNPYRSPMLAHRRVRPPLDTHDLPRTPGSKRRSPLFYVGRGILTALGLGAVLMALGWAAFHGVRLASTWR